MIISSIVNQSEAYCLVLPYQQEKTAMEALPGFTMEFATDLARQAGSIHKELFKPFGVVRETKSDNTPRTLADTMINTLVIEEVRANFPGVHIHGEEESFFDYQLGSGDWKVICDPLDGTFPFCWGHPMTTFVLALCYKGKPVMSVIYDSLQDRMFTAELGKGAFMNGQPIKVSTTDHLYGKPVVGICSWPATINRETGQEMASRSPFQILQIADRLEALGFMCVDYKSIAYMDAAVATGEFVATVFPGNQPHDSAAGDLIVREASGRATSMLGEELSYEDKGEVNGHVYSNGLLHDTIMEAIAYINTTHPIRFERKR